MPKYLYEVSVSITRVPDEAPAAAPSAAADPMATLAQSVGRAFSGQPISLLMPSRPSALSLTKAGQLEAESFPALTKILERFESLAEQVEVEHSVT
ncbi:MAG: hypothetical protein ACREVZ_00320 [Burkholderiales bacterium]